MRISESLVGLRLACTRQKAGTFSNRVTAPPRPGAVNAPAATGCAMVIVTFGSDTDDRLSQVAAAAWPAAKTSEPARRRREESMGEYNKEP